MRTILCLLLLAGAGAMHADDTSDLWGAAGEKWSGESRLPDFSFAGYRRGEEPYRIPTAQISVKDFGAKGDGKTDDIEAFRKAVAEGSGKVILIPAGRYVLSDILEIKTGNMVLRGEGMEKTVLLFSRGLEEISPKPSQTADGKTTTGWSWSGGLISVQGKSAIRQPAAKVTSTASRGATKLTLESETFKTGDEVILRMKDDSQKSLLGYLFRGQTGDASGMGEMSVLQVLRVTAVNGPEITVDRALRFDVNPAWSPTVATFAPEVTDVGIEELGFEFPAKAYAGHWEEVGWNPLQFGTETAHCWARNLRFWNADNGPFVEGVFITVEGLQFGADRKRLSKEGMAGHHGITLGGSDCLATRFTFAVSFFHDVGLASGSIGNVFSKGSAPDMNMDHHRDAPYENLFTDLDMGDGNRIFGSGGGKTRGRHTAAGATFWNLRTKAYQEWPKEEFGPDQINLIALKIRGSDTKDAGGRWLETIRPGNITPPDLHLAMRERRLGAKASAPGATVASATPAQAAQRWKSTDGREIEATFGGLNGDQVTLIMNGRPFTLPLARLSPESQALARQLATQAGAR